MVMPIASWPLHQGRPRIEIILTGALSGKQLICRLLADTGAGGNMSKFDLALKATDCQSFGTYVGLTQLGGAYAGLFPLYGIRVQIPAIGFDGPVRAVGVPTTPPNFDGIAGFRFLNRFTYGNFANKTQFGLEL